LQTNLFNIVLASFSNNGYANLYAQDIAKKNDCSAKKQVDTSLDINKKASISNLKRNGYYSQKILFHKKKSFLDEKVKYK
jgi:hypothetical protein